MDGRVDGIGDDAVLLGQTDPGLRIDGIEEGDILEDLGRIEEDDEQFQHADLVRPVQFGSQTVARVP